LIRPVAMGDAFVGLIVDAAEPSGKCCQIAGRRFGMAGAGHEHDAPVAERKNRDALA
jgi:hypothetical protein